MKVLVHRSDRLVDTAILLLRLTLGAVMFAHGAQKVLGMFGGKGLDATVTGMAAHLGIPIFLAYLSAFTEFLGGIAMIAGVAVRFFGIAITINMLVAVFAVHAPNGFFAPSGLEFPLTLAVVALAIVTAGPGFFSLDHLLFHRSREAASSKVEVTMAVSPEA